MRSMVGVSVCVLVKRMYCTTSLCCCWHPHDAVPRAHYMALVRVWPTMVTSRDCNPGLAFPIPALEIEDFAIPGSQRDYEISLRIRDWPL